MSPVRKRRTRIMRQLLDDYMEHIKWRSELTFSQYRSLMGWREQYAQIGRVP